MSLLTAHGTQAPSPWVRRFTPLIARRITNSAADRTGLVLKNQEAAQPLDADLVKNAMNEAASQAAGGTKAAAATE